MKELGRTCAAAVIARKAEFTLVLGALTLALACKPQPGLAEPELRTAAKAPGTATELAIDWYPLVKDATWMYRVTKESVIRLGEEARRTQKPGTVTDRCLGPAPDEQGIQLLQRRIEEHNPRRVDPVIVTMVQRLSVRGDSIDALSIQQLGGAKVPFEPPVPLFSFKLTNQRHRVTIGTFQMEVEQASQSTEAVQVPAGDYPNAIKRVLRGTVRGRLGEAPIERGTVVESTWFARGVGPVKVERTLDLDIRIDSTPAKASEVEVRALVIYSNGR